SAAGRNARRPAAARPECPAGRGRRRGPGAERCRLVPAPPGGAGARRGCPARADAVARRRATAGRGLPARPASRRPRTAAAAPERLPAIRRCLMNRRLAALVVLLAIAAPATAQPPPEPVRLTLRPAAAPSPALKYELLPELKDQSPGNAALVYYRAFSP